MPGRAILRLSSTSSRLFPIEETIPMPVTTTRFMYASWFVCQPNDPPFLERTHVRKKADPQVFGLINGFAVGLNIAIGNAQRQLRAHDALDIDAIFHVLEVVGDLSGEFDLPGQCTSAPGRSAPSEKKAGHLPQGIQTQASGHHRVAMKMAREEPQVRRDVELGADLAFAKAAAIIVDPGNAVEH